MSKRSEAYRLFSDGFPPKSDEVKALGLAEKTVGQYYNDWVKTLPKVKEPEVVTSLPDKTNAAALQAWAEENLKCPYDGAGLEPHGEFKNLPYYKCPECGWGTVRHEEEN